MNVYIHSDGEPCGKERSMKKIEIKPVLKTVTWGVVWALVLIGAGYALSLLFRRPAVDILFFAGMICALLGGVILNGGIRLGFSMKSLGKNDAQYVATLNQKIMETEKEVPVYEKGSADMPDKNFKSKGHGMFRGSALLTGGIICIIYDIILVSLLY